MMDVLEIARRIDPDPCLSLVSEMVRHKSYSESSGERVLAEHMVRRMGEMGLEASLQTVEGDRVNAIGRWGGTGGGKTLVFNGHLDTNPVTEGWTVDPWGGLVTDEFIYGIGVSNMKAGDAAALAAVKTLIDAGCRLKGDVVLTLVVGELQGGVGTLAAIRHGLQADCFINCEPTDLQAVTMHAEAFMFEITLEGITRHLSKREEAVDAILAACELVPELTDLKFSDAPTEAHRSINRVHVGVVHGALGRDLHEWRAPQVADFLRLKGSGRYGPGQSQSNALADMRRVLDGLEHRHEGLRATLKTEHQEGRPVMPAFEVDPDAPIVQAVNNAYRAIRGRPQPTGAITPPGFFGTDAGHLYKELGMEGVVCGPGGRYNTMPDERVEVTEYLDMVRIYLMAMAEICELA